MTAKTICYEGVLPPAAAVTKPCMLLQWLPTTCTCALLYREYMLRVGGRHGKQLLLGSDCWQSVQFHDIPLISIVDLIPGSGPAGCSGGERCHGGRVPAAGTSSGRALEAGPCHQSVGQLAASVKVVDREMRRACHAGRCATTVLQLQRRRQTRRTDQRRYLFASAAFILSRHHRSSGAASTSLSKPSPSLTSHTLNHHLNNFKTP